MTSWNRGEQNEQEGDAKMQSDDLGDKIVGAGQKLAGEVEEGIDNLGDTLSGKQGRLEGDTVDNAPERASDWVQNRADDVKDRVD